LRPQKAEAKSTNKQTYLCTKYTNKQTNIAVQVYIFIYTKAYKRKLQKCVRKQNFGAVVAGPKSGAYNAQPPTPTAQRPPPTEPPTTHHPQKYTENKANLILSPIFIFFYSFNQIQISSKLSKNWSGRRTLASSAPSFFLNINFSIIY